MVLCLYRGKFQKHTQESNFPSNRLIIPGLRWHKVSGAVFLRASNRPADSRAGTSRLNLESQPKPFFVDVTLASSTLQLSSLHHICAAFISPLFPLPLRLQPNLPQSNQHLPLPPNLLLQLPDLDLLLLYTPIHIRQLLNLHSRPL